MRYRSGIAKGRPFFPFRSPRSEAVSFGVSNDLETRGCYSSSLRMRAITRSCSYYRSILEGGTLGSLCWAMFGIFRQTGKAIRTAWSIGRSNSSTCKPTSVLAFLFRLVAFWVNPDHHATAPYLSLHYKITIMRKCFNKAISPRHSLGNFNTSFSSVIQDLYNSNVQPSQKLSQGQGYGKEPANLAITYDNEIKYREE